MLKIKEGWNYYVYISEKGIEYDILEGCPIMTGQEIINRTSDIIFIMLSDPSYNVDNNVVGWLVGASVFEDDLEGYEESIKTMVDEFEKRNFEE